MNFRQISYRWMHIAIASAFVAAAGAAVSAEPPTSSTAAAPSKEMREHMAAIHEQMAACLRSDKSIDECRTETMQKCQALMGQQGCPGMGMGMGMHHGMRHPSNQPAPNK
ncbi:MAG TPA: hypothetical protein VFS52_06250 [Steroidobacteraceae bacterium]|jgi:hypothetical protein|nr:hypothetical protein [Steroidobacteraceae bacterium]